MLLPPRGRRARIAQITLGMLAPDIRLVHTHARTNVHTLTNYKNPAVRDAIHALKFDNNVHARACFVHVAQDALLEHISDTHAFGKKVVLVSIPPSSKRIHERGHDHLHLLVQALAPMLQNENAQPMGTLSRMRETTPQRSLKKKERLRNMRGAFRFVCTEIPEETHVMILDDVVTTGGTFAEAVRACAEAGFFDVSCWALARA